MYRRIIKFLKTIIPEDMIEDRGEFYVLPTVCHNLDPKEASRKLYLYKNEESGYPVFYCYTECSKSMSIWTFIEAYYALRGKNLSLYEIKKMFYEVAGPIDFTFNNNVELKEDNFMDPMEIHFQAEGYSENCLEMFHLNEMNPWFLEGIDINILKRYEISYSPYKEGVIIPHRRLDGQLIGIRIRAYSDVKESYAKYMPLKVGNIMYTHRLTTNLYGLHLNYENIIKTKSINLFEAEKSVLQYEQMFGAENNISCALCGSIISKWVSDFIIHTLGVKTVYLMLDKEYLSNPKSIYDYIKKMEEKTRLLNQACSVYVAIDEIDAFPPKSSPTDLTIQKFKSLKLIKIGD